MAGNEFIKASFMWMEVVKTMIKFILAIMMIMMVMTVVMVVMAMVAFFAVKFAKTILGITAAIDAAFITE